MFLDFYKVYPKLSPKMGEGLGILFKLKIVTCLLTFMYLTYLLSSFMKFFRIFFRIFFIFFILTNSSCNHRSQNLLNKDATYIVDLDVEKKDTLYYSTLFKSVKCIPLETSDNSLIGEIDKMLIFEDFIFILDASKAKTLFVFDKKGLFIRKIGNIGNGPGEYVRIVDFAIDTDKKEIIIVDDLRKMMFYDIFTGKFIKTVFIAHFPISSVQYFNGMIYADLYNHPQAPDDCLMQTIDLSTGEKKDDFLNKMEYSDGYNEIFRVDVPSFISSMKPPFLFRQPFMDTFVALTSNGVKPFLTIKSEDFVSGKDVEGFDIKKMSSRNKNLIYSIHSYFSHDDYIHFTYRSEFSQSVIYDTVLKKALIYNYTNNDMVYQNNSQLNLRSIYFDESGIYDCVHAMMMGSFLRFIREDKVKDAIKEQLKELNFNSNPVLLL